ncbi:beta/alpha barrel domain-containing protein [Anaerosacchariphilus polymeriproducens]|uniref:Homocitrate synthase n=1 Tax=Anaerosacchariphilus polymeriproducens TaxID=1812858 RepID=A0A371AUH1_9FIRM|nr:homocitrate synthase [Anaerosacchariphilus polymeriproducens]RDU23140.1 homocitrate synthase [Anaerosacchariphilus polymeriproducens]
MKQQIKIVDTTLRDGEQRPGIVLNVEDKLELAQILDEIGIFEIEAGTPSIGTEGIDYYLQIREKVKKAKISVWSRSNTKDIKNAILCNPDIIHIGIPISYVQIYSKLKKNKVWVHNKISECMDLILSENIQVTIGFEDASRADEGFMIETAKLIKDNGGNILRIADTVGVLTPQRAYQIIRRIKDKVDLEIEYHGHNDLGMAVSNSIMSVKAGAGYIDCTLLGIGERSGNCNLKEFVKSTSHFFEVGIDKMRLYYAENMLLDIFHKKVN